MKKDARFEAENAARRSPSRTKMQARMAMSAPLLRLAGRL